MPFRGSSLPVLIESKSDGPGELAGKVMSRKKMIMITIVVGSFVGAYVPALLGADSLSLSLVGSTVGGVIGIWLGHKISQ